MGRKRQSEDEESTKRSNRDVGIKFTKEAKLIYDFLSEQTRIGKKKEKAIFYSIESKKTILMTNSHFGQPIAKRKIPKEYVTKFGVKNLYRLELPYFWRLLYTITNDEIKIVAFVIDIVDHKKYDKIFRY